jgi:ribosomal protein L4
LDKVNSNNIIFIEDKDLEKTNTKSINQLLKTLNFTNKKNLLVLDIKSVNLLKSSNNITRTIAKIYNKVSVKDIVNADNLIIQNSV